MGMHATSVEEMIFARRQAARANTSDLRLSRRVRMSSGDSAGAVTGARRSFGGEDLSRAVAGGSGESTGWRLFL